MTLCYVFCSLDNLTHKRRGCIWYLVLCLTPYVFNLGRMMFKGTSPDGDMILLFMFSSPIEHHSNSLIPHLDLDCFTRTCPRGSTVISSYHQLQSHCNIQRFFYYFLQHFAVNYHFFAHIF